MLGINELILPLLGGYLFLTRYYSTRYQAKQWAGYRLVFGSAVAGSILLAFSVAILFYLKWHFPLLREFCDSFFPSRYEYLDDSILAFILGFITAIALNLISIIFSVSISLFLRFTQFLQFILKNKGKPEDDDETEDDDEESFLKRLVSGVFNIFREDAERRALGEAENFGDPLQMLLAKAVGETRQVKVNLLGGKIYVGFVMQPTEIKDRTDYLVLWPYFSGYRDQETLKAVITTDYGPIYEQIRQNPQDFPNFSVTVDDCQVVIPASEIQAISLFDPKVFRSFVESGQALFKPNLDQEEELSPKP